MKNSLAFLEQKKVHLILIFLFTLLAFSNIFGNDFVIDDRTFFVNWDGLSGVAKIPSLLAGALPAGHEGAYRPVATVLAVFYRNIFGAHPFGYHLLALVSHLSATVLVYLIVSKITKKPIIAFFTALLFGVNPVHTESVTYITGSGGAMVGAFFLASFYFYLSRRKENNLIEGNYLLSVFFAFLAYFTYEFTFVLPLVLILADICFKKLNSKQVFGRIKIYSPFFAGIFLYFLARMVFSLTTFSRSFVGGDFYSGFLLTIKVLFQYILITIFPVNLAYNHKISEGIEAILYRDFRQEAFRALNIMDINIILPLFFLLILIFLSINFLRKYPVLAFGLGWFFLGLVPVLPILPQNTIFHERFVYLPSFGLIFITAWLIEKIDQQKAKNLSYILIFTLVFIYGFLTFFRNKDWKDDISIWSKDVAAAPNDNAYGYFQLGNAWADLGVVDQAVSSYQKALDVNPNFIVSMGSIGRVLNKAGKTEEAIAVYKSSLERNPYFWEAHRDLAEIYTRRADFNLARGEYEQILKLTPNFEQVRANLQNLPEVVEATQGANIADNKVWLSHHDQDLSIKVPSVLKMDRSFGRLTFSDRKSGFGIEIRRDSMGGEQKVEDYLKEQKEGLGTKVNEGKAFVPNFDFAYVKVWSPFAKASEDKPGTTLQFFLFKDKEVVEVVVFPSEAEEMASFDMILGSIKIK